jgi:hypothetical protein
LVDVKTRTKTEFGAADRAVDAEKRQPLWQPHAITPRCVGVDWSRARLTSRASCSASHWRWIRDAFPAVRDR